MGHVKEEMVWEKGNIYMEMILDNKYELINIIGKGNFGVVFLAFDQRLGRKVAIKEAQSGHITEGEIEVLKNIKHPGLPEIYDYWSDGNNDYLVMEYIEGKTLLEYMRSKEKIGEEKTLNIIEQLCDILKVLHESKPTIIYRDLKPSNIMICPDGRVVLLDFGAVAKRDYSDIESKSSYGTRGYTAPEIFKSQKATPSADIYSVGKILYEMLTCEHTDMKNGLVKNLRFRDRSISKKTEQIVIKCTEDDPMKRYQNVDEIKRAISEYNMKDKHNIFFEISKIAVALSYIFIFIMLIKPIVSGDLDLSYKYIGSMIISIAITLLIHMSIIYFPRGRRTVAIKEKQIWLTQKKMPGLWLIGVFIIGMLLGETRNVRNDMWVDLVDNTDRKVLLKDDCVYKVDDKVTLEISSEALPQNPVAVTVIAKTKAGDIYESREFLLSN